MTETTETTVTHRYVPDVQIDVEALAEVRPPAGGWPCRVCGLPYSDVTHVEDDHPDGPVGHPEQPWSAFRDRGLLWLVNTAVLHPRGYAMAVHYPEGTTIEQMEDGSVEPSGWSLMGDGTEPWYMGAPTPSQTQALLDDLFAKVEALFAEARATNSV